MGLTAIFGGRFFKHKTDEVRENETGVTEHHFRVFGVFRGSHARVGSLIAPVVANDILLTG